VKALEYCPGHRHRAASGQEVVDIVVRDEESGFALLEHDDTNILIGPQLRISLVNFTQEPNIRILIGRLSHGRRRHRSERERHSNA
jgi:hypothetical protein